MRVNVDTLPVVSPRIVTSETRCALQADGRPKRLSWRYDRAEILTDGVVHGVGVALALAGSTALIAVTYHRAGGFEAAAIVIYAVGLLAMLGFSAAYNMWPVSPRKWLLRRFDHSAIFMFVGYLHSADCANEPRKASSWLASGQPLRSEPR